MLHHIKSLTGFTIGATDGELGKVEEFYFDDESWTARYMVVKTGGWLFGKKVLVSPVALGEPDLQHKIFPVRLSTDQIKHSPDIDTEKPVSRQQEIELHRHYEWPYHDTAGIGFYGGIGLTGMIDSRVPFEESIVGHAEEQQKLDPHLRGTQEISGYQIHASDGSFGDVYDYVIDDQSWKIKYLIIDTGDWLPGKKVLISPQWIDKIDWAESAVYVDLSIEAIKNSPEFDPTQPIGEGYENTLFTYYSKNIEG